MRASFAILRVEKVKTFSALQAMEAHHSRSRETPNADPHRTCMNEVLCGEGQPSRAVADRLKDVKHRKDAVLALEVLMSASPDFFNGGAGASASDRLQAFKQASLDWLAGEFGPDNVVSAVLHLDESTPHIHAVVVPLDHGKLRAGKWLNGRTKLQQLQTSYAQSLAKLGLVRGLKGSKAKHTHIQRHYGQIERIRRAQAERLRGLKAVLNQADEIWALTSELLPYLDAATIHKAAQLGRLTADLKTTMRVFGAALNEPIDLIADTQRVRER